MTKAQELGITEFPYKEYDENGVVVYEEQFDGSWVSVKLTPHGDMIHWENHEGISVNFENGMRKYTVRGIEPNGGWKKFECDTYGNVIYWETSLGESWRKEQ
jgi:hypothetical protein